MQAAAHDDLSILDLARYRRQHPARTSPTRWTGALASGLATAGSGWRAPQHAGIASAATAVLIAHVAAGNLQHPRRRGRDHAAHHEPLQVAEHSARWARFTRGDSILASGGAPAPTRRLRAHCSRYYAGRTNSRRTWLELLGTSSPQAGAGSAGREVRAIEVEGGSSAQPVRRAAGGGLGALPSLAFRAAALETSAGCVPRHLQAFAAVSKPHVMLALNVVAAEPMPRRAPVHHPAAGLRNCVAGDRGWCRRRWQVRGDPTRVLHTQRKSGVDAALECAVVGAPDTVRSACRRSCSGTSRMSCCSPRMCSTTRPGCIRSSWRWELGADPAVTRKARSRGPFHCREPVQATPVRPHSAAQEISSAVLNASAWLALQPCGGVLQHTSSLRQWQHGFALPEPSNGTVPSL